MPRHSNAEESMATLIEWEGLPTPQREFQFIATRKWRFDFCWPERKLALEVEGGSWIGGHSGVRFEADCDKYNAAALLGYALLRVTPKMVEDGRAIAVLKEALNLGWSTNSIRG